VTIERSSHEDGYVQQPGVLPVRPKVSVDVEWNGAMELTEIDNTEQHFKGTFLSTNATIVWFSQRDGFHFDSGNRADPRTNLVSVPEREKKWVFLLEIKRWGERG
jgi:hypothetical protein